MRPRDSESEARRNHLRRLANQAPDPGTLAVWADIPYADAFREFIAHQQYLAMKERAEVFGRDFTE